MIKQVGPVWGGGGGNIPPPSGLVIRRAAAIGDAVAATVVADKLIDLGYRVVFQTHPSIIPVIRRHPRISEVVPAGGGVHANLDGAYEKDPLRRQRHFYQMFMESAQRQLRGMGINLGAALNCHPKLFVPHNVRQAARARFAPYPKPWVFICPRSDSYACRQIPDWIWSEAAKKINGTKFWLGRHPAPADIIDLRCQSIDNVIDWLSVADLMISVDTGPLHIAAALDIPILAMSQSSSPELHLSDQDDFYCVRPPLDCLNCQQNVCPLDRFKPPCQNFNPEQITNEANSRLEMYSSEKVSAIVAIWKPKAEVLNRCLEALLPQVDEIIVTAAADAVCPSNGLQHPSIRYVTHWKRGIGYSGNANFGARHSNGKYLLFINDDCFLKPNAVAAMKSLMGPGVGLVSNLLRYPDGTIYHAGKVRSAGVRGWGHIDHKKFHPTYQKVTELENCCGCCVMTPRQVFYQCGGYDEELPIFAQDDVYALTVRRLGYKILFTPFSEGVHMEHQSVNKVGNIANLVGTANSVFARKFGQYLEHNLNRVPFGNFDY